MSPGAGRDDVDDEALVVRLRQGDEGAFDELYRRYSDRLMAYLQRMVGDVGLSQDLLQEVFLRLVERPGAYDPRRPLARWLFAVAHNLCCSALRRRGVRRDTRAAVALESQLRAESARPPEPDAAVDSERFADGLRSALADLDPERRSAFLLRHGEGFSIGQISAVLGCPAGTVKSRLFHASRQLAARLRPFDPQDPEPGSDGGTAP